MGLHSIERCKYLFTFCRQSSCSTSEEMVDINRGFAGIGRNGAFAETLLRFRKSLREALVVSSDKEKAV